MEMTLDLNMNAGLGSSGPALVAPVNTVAPAVTGTAQTGSVLTSSTGTWTGTAPIVYTYQWKRNGGAIGGATVNTYTLVSADSGQTILCTVTATNAVSAVSADSNSVVSFAAETNAFVARFTTPPTAPRKLLINTSIQALLDGSVYTLIDAIYFYAGADQQCSLLNVKGATYNSTITGTVGFVADRGFTGNGTNGAVDTNFNPTTAATPNYIQNSASFGMWCLTVAQNSVTPAGFFNVTGTTINPRSTGNDIVIRINQSATFSTVGSLVTTGAGLTVATRTGAAVNRIGKNGVKLRDGTDVSVAPVAGTLKYGTIGNATWSTDQFAGGFISSGLTEAQELIVYNAMNSYMMGVGAA